MGGPHLFGRPSVNPPIGKALAGNALEHVGGALAVIDALRRAVVVAEVEIPPDSAAGGARRSADRRPSCHA